MKASWGGVLLLVAVMPAAAQSTRTVTTASGARASYSRDAGLMVIGMREELGELRDADRGPSVRVFGDGRAVIHFPAYMKQAGDHESRLTAEQVDELVRSAIEGGVPEFDTAVVKEERLKLMRSRQAAGAELYEESDPSVTEIAIDFVSVDAASGGQAKRAAGRVRRSVRWPGLSADARRFPQLPAIQGLEGVRQRLAALLQSEPSAPNSP